VLLLFAYYYYWRNRTRSTHNTVSLYDSGGGMNDVNDWLLGNRLDQHKAAASNAVTQWFSLQDDEGNHSRTIPKSRKINSAILPPFSRLRPREQRWVRVPCSAPGRRSVYSLPSCRFAVGRCASLEASKSHDLSCSPARTTRCKHHAVAPRA